SSQNVLVGADLPWYPVEGMPEIRAAPDVFVVFGRPKGYRGSDQQWLEEDVPMTVVYRYDPYKNRLRVYLRKNDMLLVFHPNGEKFAPSEELKARQQQAEERAAKAEEHAGKADERATKAEERAGKAEKRATKAEERAARMAQLIARLRGGR